MEGEQAKKFSFLDEFRIIRTLGSGYQATVKLAIDQNGNYVAIKKYKTQNTDMKALNEELSILKNLNQENIVKLIAVRQNSTYKKKDETQYKCFAIILQYCAGGQLFDFICETGRFSQKVTRTYFHQMMSGIHYIHQKGYAHRDIKPQNLLLSNQFKLKIADFGFSCLLKGHDGSGVLRTKLGTQGYMAPQIVKKNYQGKSVDIFATGVILFIMYAGNPPFQRTNEGDAYFKLIIQKDFEKFWKYHQRRRKPGFFSDSFKSLFVHMVAADPKDRPNIVQIASHPWVKQALVSHADITNEFTERKTKLDQILSLKRQQEQKNKQLHLQAISNQTNPDRSNSQSDEQFVEIYNQQLFLKRNIEKGQINSKDGFIIEQNVAFAVSELLHRLKDIRVQIYNDQDNQQLQQSQSEGSFISFNKLIDSKGSQLQVEYKYKYGLDDFQEQVIVAKLNLNQDGDSHLIVNLQRESGNMFYYKRLATQIKNRFKIKN